MGEPALNTRADSKVGLPFYEKRFMRYSRVTDGDVECRRLRLILLRLGALRRGAGSLAGSFSFFAGLFLFRNAGAGLSSLAERDRNCLFRITDFLAPARLQLAFFEFVHDFFDFASAFCA